MTRQEKVDRPLIFLHIPKTGGTTLHGLLSRNFTEKEQHYVQPDVSRSRAELEQLPAAERAQLRLLHGHMAFGWHALLPTPVTYCTFVREPVDRVVSHYNYVKYGSNHFLTDPIVSHNMTITDYVKSGISDEANNGQVRLLSGIEELAQEPYGKSKISYGNNDLELLDRALAHIETHFSFVGLIERYDESVLLMKHIYHFRHSLYRKSQVGKKNYRGDKPTERDIDVIKEYNQLDEQLYQCMRQRFEEALKTHPLRRGELTWYRLRNNTRQRLRDVARRIRGA